MKFFRRNGGPLGAVPAGGDVTAPTITSSAATTVAENSALSYAPTADEAVNWSITGGADQALFSIVGSNLTMTAKDFEIPVDGGANNTYIVQVTASDGSGNSSNQTITVTVTNLDESTPGYPVFTSSAAQTVDENEPFSLSLTTDISATFSVIGGADAALFDLSGSTVDAEAFDYELPADANGDNVYEITVRATSVADPSKYTDQAVTITVGDVAEGGGVPATAIYDRAASAILDRAGAYVLTR